MKAINVLAATVVCAGIPLAASSQPPGGRGFTPPTFDSINQADAQGNKDDFLSLEEVSAWFAQMAAGRGGGGGGMNVAAIFASWDTLPEGAPDGKITQEEFDARPQGMGRGGPGRGGPQQ